MDSERDPLYLFRPLIVTLSNDLDFVEKSLLFKVAFLFISASTQIPISRDSQACVNC